MTISSDGAQSVTDLWENAKITQIGEGCAERQIDECAVAEFFALGEPCGLRPNIFMAAHGRGELQTEPLAPGLAQGGHVCQGLFGFLGKGCHGFPQCKELVFGAAHQLHEDATLAATAAATGTHDLCALLLEGVDLAVQLGPAAAALLDDVVDELSRFFCA